ncbi:MAG: hypothetical protein IKJ13_05520 [Clostridia bacterium]|nr:hypothetical protein [Clostridia bacterium]
MPCYALGAAKHYDMIAYDTIYLAKLIITVRKHLVTDNLPQAIKPRLPCVKGAVSKAD